MRTPGRFNTEERESGEKGVTYEYALKHVLQGSLTAETCYGCQTIPRGREGMTETWVEGETGGSVMRREAGTGKWVKRDTEVREIGRQRQRQRQR